MLHEPKLLLLDEPTAGVDPKARRDFWEEIHRLAADGITVLVSTHYMDEAERCHRLAYIAYGKLLATGTPDEVLHAARLSTWEVSGERAEAGRRSPRLLRAQPGVAQVTAFGNTLHVTGERCGGARARDRAVPGAGGPGVEEAHQPGLEDVFIHLMRRRKRRNERVVLAGRAGSASS